MPSSTPASTASLEALAQQAIQDKTLSAAACEQLYRSMESPLSPKERRIMTLLQDAIANRHIHVVS